MGANTHEDQASYPLVSEQFHTDDMYRDPQDLIQRETRRFKGLA